MVRQASGPHRQCTPCLTQNHPLPRLPGGIMSAKEMLQTLGTSIASTASVKSVFGDPIRADGKTIVPVARVAYGFGAGFGRGEETHQAAATQHGEGGGGGGGLTAVPAGVL